MQPQARYLTLTNGIPAAGTSRLLDRLCVAPGQRIDQHCSGELPPRIHRELEPVCTGGPRREVCHEPRLCGHARGAAAGRRTRSTPRHCRADPRSAWRTDNTIPHRRTSRTRWDQNPCNFAAEHTHQHRALRRRCQPSLLQHRRHYHERAYLQRELQRSAGAVDAAGWALGAVRACLHMVEGDRLRGQRRRIWFRRNVVLLSGIFLPEPRTRRLRSHKQPSVLGNLQPALRSRSEVGEPWRCIVAIFGGFQLNGQLSHISGAPFSVSPSSNIINSPGNTLYAQTGQALPPDGRA